MYCLYFNRRITSAFSNSIIKVQTLLLTNIYLIFYNLVIFFYRNSLEAYHLVDSNKQCGSEIVMKNNLLAILELMTILPLRNLVIHTSRFTH